MGQKLDICAEPRLKVAYLHNIGHGGRGKVGVKLKNNFQCKKIVKKGQTYTLCSPKGLLQLNTRKKIPHTRVL